MTYLLNKDGFYYFNRKVPLFLKANDPRPFVRFALHTDSRKDAQKLSLIHNESVENYWRALVRENRQHCEETFKAVTLQARRSGFISQGEEPFRPVSPAVSNERKQNSPTIQEGLELFWEYTKDKALNKSPNQLRKWRNPRKLAVANLIRVIGNKPMT
ncbi:MAG: DUF6538 domain-containing protein, partial [Bacteroidota bacterium]